MTDINLRPWRKIKRERIKKEYTQKLFVIGLLSFLVMGIIYQFYKHEITVQQARNNYLTTVNKEMDKKISEIEDLKKQKTDILNRMTIINSLQGDRKLTVKVLDELNILTPSGINLTLLSRTEGKYKFEGVSGLNNDISEFLENIQKSDFFVEPKLGKINLLVEENKKDKVINFLTNAEKNKFFITANQKDK